MRLSRSRLLLRAAMLLFLAGFLAWRARGTGLSAQEAGLEPGAARLMARLALLEWLLGGLALLTAGGALLALRRRPRDRPLRLGEPPAGGSTQ